MSLSERPSSLIRMVAQYDVIRCCFTERSYRLQLTRTHISVIEHRLLSAEKYDDSHRAAVEGRFSPTNSIPDHHWVLLTDLHPCDFVTY